jgi:hypothetical protein
VSFSLETPGLRCDLYSDRKALKRNPCQPAWFRRHGGLRAISIVIDSLLGPLCTLNDQGLHQIRALNMHLHHLASWIKRAVLNCGHEQKPLLIAAAPAQGLF